MSLPSQSPLRVLLELSQTPHLYLSYIKVSSWLMPHLDIIKDENTHSDSRDWEGVRGAAFFALWEQMMTIFQMWLCLFDNDYDAVFNALHVGNEQSRLNYSMINWSATLKLARVIKHPKVYMQYFSYLWSVLSLSEPKKSTWGSDRMST